MKTTQIKKINVCQPAKFEHHRDGWNVATECLATLHNPSGVFFFDWADKIFKKNESFTGGKWCGILHNVIDYPNDYPEKYHKKCPCLSNLVSKQSFHDSLENCLGLFTLCKHTANYLSQRIHVPVTDLVHPIKNSFPEFSWDKFASSQKRIVSIGQWLRRHQSIHQLKVEKYKKTIICMNWVASDYEEMNKYTSLDPSVEMLKYLENKEYDNLLTKSIVFLDLYDVAACNVILECLIRGTPIVTRKLPANVEYLGGNYPLFFESIEEAEDKIKQEELLLEASNFLKKINKKRFSPENFIKSLIDCENYQKLPCITI